VIWVFLQSDLGLGFTVISVLNACKCLGFWQIINVFLHGYIQRVIDAIISGRRIL
jgi:hypothetical protein